MGNRAELSLLFEPEASAEEGAGRIMEYVSDPAAYETLRTRVEQRSEVFPWDHTVARLMALWEGSDEFRFDCIISA